MKIPVPVGRQVDVGDQVGALAGHRRLVGQGDARLGEVEGLADGGTQELLAGAGLQHASGDAHGHWLASPMRSSPT